MIQILDKYGNTSTDDGRVIIVDKFGHIKKLGGSASPTGPAGGDLSGTYPNPSVVWANGEIVYNGLYYPLSTNPAGYLTSSALTPYLTSATAALTYYPIPTGTTTQYIRGDGSLATFPTIPTVGTWGALNYPTWTTGTPFVKMTAAGTFALDTNTYLTTAVTSVAALTLGTSGTDLSSTVANGTTTPVITLNVPTASATNRGALSSTDWSTFNNKQNSLGFTPYRYVNSTQSIGSASSGETQLIRIPILASTFASNDKIYIKVIFSKTGIINAATIRIKLTTASSMPAGNVSQIAQYSFANTSTFISMERTMAITGGNLKGFNFTTNALTDVVVSTATLSTVAFDVTQVQYLYVSILPAITTVDISYLEYINVSNI